MFHQSFIPYNKGESDVRSVARDVLIQAMEATQQEPIILLKMVT